MTAPLDSPYMVSYRWLIVTYGLTRLFMRDINLQNMSDLKFDLSRSLNVKSNGAFGLPMYVFLLVSNSNYMSKSPRLGVIAT